jgi:Protein of unknown function (DUF1572)
MTTSFRQNYLDSSKKLFRYYKSLGDKSLAQIDEEKIHFKFEENSNNIATIVKHIAGNMLSRWTDFLIADGEKEWRNRETEFEDTFRSKAEMMACWEKGWACLFDAIDPLNEEDLDKIIYIRNEGHSVLEAMNRQLAHYSYHVGQLVFVIKALKAEGWQTLSIPKGKSGDFNQDKFGKDKKRKYFI